MDSFDAWVLRTFKTYELAEEWSDKVGEESRKTWKSKFFSDFFWNYCNGVGLDIGGTGYLDNVRPILPTATIIDLNYKGYDGKFLPFLSESQDYIYSSHCLEHIQDYKASLYEWYRVTKVGGHIIIVVPHQWLYERKESLPSHWNEDHKRFYTSASLCKEIEESLPINSFRIRHLKENDEDHTYGVPVETHANGCYEIEIVLEKLK